MNRTSHRPRKRFGQHFLTDDTALEKIIAAIQPRPGEHLVEIGPGRGALTAPLLQAAACLTAIELDRDLAAALPGRLGQSERLRIIQADALQIDLSALEPRPYRLIGNLPYNISSPLLFHFLRHASAWRDATLMLQREVALRLCARAGDRDNARLGVMASLFCHRERLFDILPQAFSPPPAVVSSMVRLRPRKPEITDPKAQLAFETLVRKAFARRRKTLANNLRGVLDRGAINASGIDPDLRPQQLELGHFLALFKQYRRAAAME